MKEYDILKNIIRNRKFKKDIEELGSYARGIKHERQIVCLIAKYLNRRGENYALEHRENNKHTDLIINMKKIEFKFHYDHDIPKLKEWLDKKINNKYSKINKYIGKGKSYTWLTGPLVYRDLKDSDIFVWIIVFRDITKLNKYEKVKICSYEKQENYEYKKDVKGDLENAYNFIKGACKSFKSKGVVKQIKKIECNAGKFKYNYCFLICTFKRINNQI